MIQKISSLFCFCTISVYHKIKVIPGRDYLGSKEPSLQWKRVSDSNYECFWNSSYRAVYTSDRSGNVIGFSGQSDGTPSNGVNSNTAIYQRPALYRLDNYGKDHSSI